jgi:ankyrin repeat protein
VHPNCMRRVFLIIAIVGAAGVASAATNEWTALHTAASAGDVETARTVLRQHPEYLNSREAGSHTPLHVAVFDRQTNATALLIQCGADVNAPDVCGWSPLHTAAYRGEAAVAEQLIAGGADVNLKDHTGQTPLRLAIKYNHPDVAQLLRRHGAHE